MIEVYGREGCDYCKKAQELLEQKKIPYNYIQLGIDITVDEFKEKFPEQKTVPVVTNHGFKIGGFTDLQAYIEETSGGYGHDI